MFGNNCTPRHGCVLAHAGMLRVSAIKDPTHAEVRVQSGNRSKMVADASAPKVVAVAFSPKWVGHCGRAELAASQNGASGERAPKQQIKVEVPQWAGSWVVTMDQYKDGLVGAKSKNIAGE